MNEIAESSTSSYTLRRLVTLIRPHLPLFLAAMLALLGGSAINLLFPEIIRRLLNSDAHHYLVETPYKTGSALLALFAAQGLCFYFRSLLFGYTGQRVVASLRKQLYNSIIAQRIEFFDQRRTGDLVSRLSSDTQMVQDAVSLRLSVLIRYSVQVAAGVVLMAVISLVLTAALLLILPILIGVSIVLGKRLRRYSKAVQTELGAATTIAEETFSQARVVKAFGQEPFEQNRYASAADSVLSLGLKRTRLAAFFASFVSFLMNAAIVVVLFIGIGIVAHSSSLTYGDLTAFLLYGVIVAVSFAFISGAYSELLQALGAAERVFEIIDLSDHDQFADGSQQTLPESGTVSFQHVDFAYPSRPDVPVLHQISFDIQAGTTTALVGPSGSGKSTIMSLILRFYDPTSGAILFGGVDLRTIAPSILRQRMAYVPQEPAMFAVSILENIRYGNLDANEDDVRRVAAQANLLEFIETLPDGFDTLCGDRGIHLSGGQRQRLAIARAMLKDPLLLLLDEATSALDSENEALVQQALETLMVGRTAVVIAHRLSTIKSADQVLVIDSGQVVQSGRHDTLTAQTGLYQQLVERQQLGVA